MAPRIRITPIIDGPVVPVAPVQGDGRNQNVNGPSLLRVPDWVKNPLGTYYLYFADHKSDRIELAYAERLVVAYGFDIDSEAAAELVGLLAEGALRRYLALPPSERPVARKRLLGGLVRFTLEGIRGLSRPETNIN